VSGLLLALGVLVSMAIKDTAGSATTVLIADGHGLVAAQFDTIGDVAAIFCIGVSGATIFRDGASWTSLGVLLGVWLGSQLGTVAGTRTGKAVARFLERTS